MPYDDQRLRPGTDRPPARLRPFGEPEAAPPLATTLLEPGEHHWRVIRDLASHVSTLEVVNDQGSFRIDETGTTVRRATNEWFSVRGNDTTSARGETRTERCLERGDWRVRVTTRTVLTCNDDEFLVNAQLDAYELDEELGDPRVWSGSWQLAIPRDLV